MHDEPDHYERLGITRGADAQEIRHSYLQLAARYHPDRHQGNPLGDLAKERLVEINAAYHVLSDPTRRAAYDARVRSSAAAPGFWGTPEPRPRARHAPEPPGGRGPAGAARPRRNRGRPLLPIVLVGVSAFVGLRLAPRIARVFAGIFGPGPGRILFPVLLAGVVAAIIYWSRARRSK